jgi:hypothetical protein
MTEEKFWDVIQRLGRLDTRRTREWDQRLQAELRKLPADQIIEWNHIFDRLAASAYTVDLWGAAYVINGGASDDGFYYFRCWLIGMGREIYTAALQYPDSLFDVVTPGLDAEAEIYAAAHLAWMAVTKDVRGPLSSPKRGGGIGWRRMGFRRLVGGKATAARSGLALSQAIPQ